MKQSFKTVEELISDLPDGSSEILIRLVWFLLEPEKLLLKKQNKALKDTNSNLEDSLNIHLTKLVKLEKELNKLKEKEIK